MNQVFDFSRFSLLVSRHWVENRQRYILSLSAIGGLVLLWFIFLFLMEIRRTAIPVQIQTGTYYFVLFASGCLYASTIFSSLGSKGKGINYLSVPASHLEKLLVAILYSVVLFFISYTIVFYLIDIITLQIFNTIAKSNFVPTVFSEKYEWVKLANVFSSDEFMGEEVPYEFLYYIMLAYFAVQSMFMAGSIFFSKFSFIKTFILLLVVGLLYWLSIFLTATQILPKGDFHDEALLTYKVLDNSGEVLITLPAWLINTGKFLLRYGFPPLLWLASFHRLKEKEI
jgi:hypothetical protein